MYNTWTRDGQTLDVKALSEFAMANAHDWYAAANVLEVTEASGEVFPGGSDSIHREEAFSTASEYFNCSYDTFYDAWLSGTPIPAEVRASAAAAVEARDGGIGF